MADRAEGPMIERCPDAAPHITGWGAIAATFGSTGPRILLTIALSTSDHSIDVIM
jgi:hypothetical protein